MIDRILGDLRVVELSGVSTLFCGKLFADLGAEVTKVEPPGGDPARKLPPLVPCEGGELSMSWVSYDIGKHHRELDLESERGRTQLIAMLAEADLLLHDMPAARAESLGLGWKSLHDRYPRLIVAAITPFGSTGPYADRASSDLVQVAMSGYLHMTGPGDGRPMKPSAPLQSYLHASNHAFAAALLALRHRDHTGEGSFIDQSARETGTWMLTHTYQHWDMLKVNLKRQGQNRDMGSKKRLRSVFHCADGFVVWMFATGHVGSRGLAALVKWMQRDGMAPAWLTAIDWANTDLLAGDPDLSTNLEAEFAAFLLTKTGEELLEFAISSGLMMAPANTVADVGVDAQLLARESWRTVRHPQLGQIRVPGPPVRMRGIRWEPREEPAMATTSTPRAKAGADDGSKLPLSGVRVLDFGSTLAAPTAARLMADFGADVIKIESHVHPDTLRVGTPYIGGMPGVDRSGYFAAYNAGKRSFSLNLQSEGAHAIVRALVEKSDVLVENFAPGVMTRLGLTPERLWEWNPQLIIASHALQGQTGPRSRHRGYGQIASGMTGWYDLTGESGGEPLGPYSAYTDFLSWPLLFSSILLGLKARDESGEGQHIDHAQVESSLHFLAPLLLHADLTGHMATRQGNHEDHLAPNNAYLCAGDDDRWVAFSVASDDQWQALCTALDAPALAGDGRFASHARRKANESELDAALDVLAARIDAEELVTRLQAAGVAVGTVARGSDLFADPQLGARGFFTRLTHPELGDHAVLTPSFRISGVDSGPHRGAPCLGEHTFEIASDLLGLDGETIGDLVARGILQ